jgi:hypothetical protein
MKGVIEIVCKINEKMSWKYYKIHEKELHKSNRKDTESGINAPTVS